MVLFSSALRHSGPRIVGHSRKRPKAVETSAAGQTHFSALGINLGYEQIARSLSLSAGVVWQFGLMLLASYSNHFPLAWLGLANISRKHSPLLRHSNQHTLPGYKQVR